MYCQDCGVLRPDWEPGIHTCTSAASAQMQTTLGATALELEKWEQIAHQHFAERKRLIKKCNALVRINENRKAEIESLNSLLSEKQVESESVMTIRQMLQDDLGIAAVYVDDAVRSTVMRLKEARETIKSLQSAQKDMRGLIKGGDAPALHDSILKMSLSLHYGHELDAVAICADLDREDGETDNDFRDRIFSRPQHTPE